MAGIDASIISGFKPPQTNPLETIGKIQGVATGILNNRMLNQEIQGKEAVGRAVTSNTDTETGQTDWDKAAASLNLDPQGAWKANEFGQQILERKAKEIANETAKAGLTQAQLATSQKKFEAVGNWAAAIAAAGAKDPAALTLESILGSAKGALIDTHMINPQDPKERDMLLSVMSEFGPDPKKNAEFLKRLFLQSHATSEGVAMVLGTPSTLDTGSAVQTRQVAPLTGEVATLATTPKGLSPGESAALVEVTDPVTLEKKLVPRGSMGDQAGAAPATGTQGNGRYPGAQTLNTTPGAVAIRAPAPGVAEARTTSAQESAKTFQKDVSEAGGYAQRAQGLNLAYDNLVKAETGPGAKKLQDFRAVFNTFGVNTPGSKAKVESYAEAQKYLQDYANRRGSELGIGTDAGRALVNAANPGVQTPKGAALQVVNVIKGLERMQAAQVAAAQTEGVQPDQYASWRAKWNRSVDPAAFAPPKLDKAGWEAKRKAMGDKWPSYAKGLNAALAAGVLTAADLRK